MTNSTPSMLLKFKEWLLIPDAAKRLSVICEEEVSEADILHLALDGHLKLSVLFVNSNAGRKGKIVPYEGEYLSDCQIIDKGLMFEFEDEQVNSITGVWDLPLVGGERTSIEQKWQDLTGGHTVKRYILDGAFVESSEGVAYQLQQWATVNYQSYNQLLKC